MLEKFRAIWSCISEYTALVLTMLITFTEGGNEFLQNQQGVVKGSRPGSGNKPGSTQAQPLNVWVTFQRSFPLSEPQLPHLKMRKWTR